MRADVGFVAAHVVLAAPGFALLWALGLLHPRLTRLPAALGPAYLFGVAVTMPALIALLVVGVTVSLPVTLLVTAAITAALWRLGLVAHRRGLFEPAEPADDVVEPPRGERWLARLGIATVAIYAAAGTQAFGALPVRVDDWRIWGMKGLALLDTGRLRPEVFLEGPYAHLDYPVLQPLLHATIWRFQGTSDLQLAHTELWIVLACFVWTVGFLLAPYRRAITWLPVIALLLTLSPLVENVGGGNADVTVAAFAALGALGAGLWLETRRPAHLLIAAVALGAAANTKNEGQAAAAVVLVVVGLVAAWGSWRPLRRRPGPGLVAWLGAAGVVVVMFAPWRLWTATHGLRNVDTIGARKALFGGELGARTERVEPTIEALVGQLANQGAWGYILPAFLLLALVCLGRPVLRRPAALYLGVVLALFTILVGVYMFSVFVIADHLVTSVPRTVIGLQLVAAVGIAHLAGAAWAQRDEPRWDAPTPPR